MHQVTIQRREARQDRRWQESFYGIRSCTDAKDYIEGPLPPPRRNLQKEKASEKNRAKAQPVENKTLTPEQVSTDRGVMIPWK